MNWADLESEDQVFEGPGWREIDRAIADHPGWALRLRVFAGVHAPGFVKAMGGAGLSSAEHDIDASEGGVAIWNRWDQRGGVIPRFWEPAVLDQYEQLMAEVARRCDDVPEIREVVASGCMTLYAEPFYRAHGDAGTNERLWEAGLNFEKDLAAHRRVIEIHDRLFRRTRTSLAINAWDIIDDSADHHRSSFEATARFVDWARERMGPKLVLQNNGTGLDADPDQGTPRTNHFAYLRQADPPKGFQTRTLPRLGGTKAGIHHVLDFAVAMDACFVEMPGGFGKVVDLDGLRDYDRKLEANVRPASP